jgi:hypothetical protein
MYFCRSCVKNIDSAFKYTYVPALSLRRSLIESLILFCDYIWENCSEDPTYLEGQLALEVPDGSVLVRGAGLGASAPPPGHVHVQLLVFNQGKHGTLVLYSWSWLSNSTWLSETTRSIVKTQGLR